MYITPKNTCAFYKNLKDKEKFKKCVLLDYQYNGKILLQNYCIMKAC